MDSARARTSWVGSAFALVLVALVLVALVLLHLVPPHGGPDPVVLGVFPWDLAWHLLWMVAAGAAVLMMTSVRLWPDDPPDDRAPPP